MKVLILRGAMLFGVGVAIGYSAKMQPVTAACYGTQACSTNECCKGNARSNGIHATTGVKSIAMGVCGELWKPAPNGGICDEQDAVDTHTPCGGHAAVPC